ncbi:hypothetical protein [Methylobacterium oryzae]|uniref:hypothetical protein n=1 Tax=Methylobacterium oryzae TaxID=334852 RepID=UPI002F34FB47
MDRQQQAAFLDSEREIHDLRFRLLDVRIGQIDRFDADEDFAAIVTKALECGLGKEELLAELPCSWSTVTRWASGQVKPARIARRAIKAKLIEMLGRKRSEHIEEARHLVAA